MPREIRIYFEGDRLLQPGFHTFFSALRKRAKEERVAFHLIATGGTPCRDFAIALKTNPNVEQIPKRDLQDGLSTATRHTPKGDYFKTRHRTDRTYWLGSTLSWCRKRLPIAGCYSIRSSRDFAEDHFVSGARRHAY